MSEEQGCVMRAIRNGICWVEFYSKDYNDEDLCLALKHCGLYPPHFEFETNWIGIGDKPILEKTPIKGAMGDIWVVKGSVRKNGDGPVGQPK